jgi:type II secretory pathway pseudopilin PulG
MNHVLRRVDAMFQNLRRAIFGVPDTAAAAARNATRQQQQAEQPPTFAPEHALSAVAIAGGVDADGHCYQFWREDPEGIRWFRRITGDDAPRVTTPTVADDFDGFSDDSVMIRGDADFADDLPDDADDLTDDVRAGQLLLRQVVTGDYESPSNTAEALENVRLRNLARRFQNRMQGWPITDDGEGANDE